jgi:hypothetical protein
MNDQNSALMITVLRNDYPEIARIISEKINKTLPEQALHNPKLIGQIVASFKNEKGIDELNWIKGKSAIKIVESRELLTAVVLMFYHREKILNSSPEKTRSGVLRELRKQIGVSQEVSSKTAANAIVAFKVYENFRQEVYRLYELIKIENKFFR